MRERTYEAVVATFAALLILSGCGAGTPDVPVETQSTPEAQTVEQEPPQALSTAKTEAAARPITDEEILAAYDRAVEAYSWFDLTALPCTTVAETVNDWTYYQVDAPGIADLNDLGLYLRSLFSEEIAEQLLATGGEHPLYADVNGALYTTGGARGADIQKGAVTVQVSQTEAAVYSVNVTVETLAADLTTVTGLECWSFPYELIGDRWVFTSFDLVY